MQTMGITIFLLDQVERSSFCTTRSLCTCIQQCCEFMLEVVMNPGERFLLDMHLQCSK